MRGVVKWFDQAKGFGFVVDETGGVDILLHANVLRNFGQSSVADGAHVGISVQDTARGLQAVSVFSRGILCRNGGGDWLGLWLACWPRDLAAQPALRQQSSRSLTA